MLPVFRFALHNFKMWKLCKLWNRTSTLFLVSLVSLLHGQKKCQIEWKTFENFLLEKTGKNFACHSCVTIQEHPQPCHCCYTDTANFIHVKSFAPKFRSPYSLINSISVELSAISINLAQNPTRLENFAPFNSLTGKIQCKYVAVSV